MNADLVQLVSDTLSFLRQDLKVTPTPPPVKPVIIRAKASASAPVPAPKQPPSPVAAAPKKELPSLLDKIRKHLPHLQLIPAIPVLRCVAIVVANQEDLPFLKNLKNAIEKHHCPVKMIQGDVENWDQFELVISQREVPAKRKILLESIATYQNNTEQKKLLWSTICNHLSPKSS